VILAHHENQLEELQIRGGEFSFKPKKRDDFSHAITFFLRIFNDVGEFLPVIGYLVPPII